VFVGSQRQARQKLQGVADAPKPPAVGGAGAVGREGLDVPLRRVPFVFGKTVLGVYLVEFD
jgi:hypothetical protein